MLHINDIDEYCELNEDDKLGAIIEAEVNSFDLLLAFHLAAIKGRISQFDECVGFTESYCCFSFPEIDLRDVDWDNMCDIAEDLNISRRITSEDYFVGAVIREYYKKEHKI